MIKKIIPLTTILLLIIMLMAISMTFAVKNDNGIITKTNANNTTPEIITENYINMKNPNMIAANTNHIASTTSNGVTIIDLATRSVIASVDYSLFGESITADTITSIAIWNDFVYLLDDSRNIKAFDYVTFTTKNFETPSSPWLLFNDNTNLYTVNTDNSISTYFENGIDTTSDYAAGLSRANMIKAFGGNLYSCQLTSSTSTIRKLEKNGTGVSTVINEVIDDFVIINELIATLRHGGDLKTLENTYGGAKKNLQHIATNGEYIFATDKDYDRINILKSDLSTNTVLGSYGDEINRLNQPTHIASNNEKIFIADNLNARVVVFDINTASYKSYTVKGAPLLVSPHNNGFYMYNGNALLTYNYTDTGVALTNEISINSIIDLTTFNNNPIVLTSNGDIKYASETTIIVNLSDAKHINISQNSNIMYITSNSKLIRYNLLNNEVSIKVDFEGTNVIDLTVDSLGKIFAYTKSSIITYAIDYTAQGELRTTQSLSLLGTSNNYATTMLSNGNVYLTDKTNSALALLSSSDINSSSDEVFDNPSASQWNVIKAAQITNDSTLYFTSPNNLESISFAKNGSNFLCLAEITYENEIYRFGVSDSDGLFRYVKAKDITLLDNHIYDSNTTPVNALLVNGANVYMFPYNDSPIQNAVNFDTVMQRVKLVAGTPSNSIWGWYQIKYTFNNIENTGYVKCHEVAEVSSLKPENSQKMYKVKASTIGEKINLYHSADESSEVLSELNDGDSVLVTIHDYDPNSKFTKVSCGDLVGYILTENLQESGFTSMQITAIIVSSICIISLMITIPLLIALYRKKRTIKIDDEPKVVQ